MKKGQSKDNKKTEKHFVWTDEETALLMQVIIDYKAYKTADGLDWESVKKKYEEITERFQARYPKIDSGVSEEAFPNCNDPTAFTK